MSLIVQKYGGTSVANPKRIRNVAKKILADKSKGNHLVVVVSAMAGVTNNLIELSRKVSKHPTRREMDVLLATGEQTTIALTSMAINDLGGKAISLTGAQAGITTEGKHTSAKIANITPQKITKLLAEGYVLIIAGFQGMSQDGNITTLGRGGSDLSAIALAAVLRSDKCQIFTDVDGVYTCDPNRVPQAKKLKELSYDEMLEMSSLGSKVMQARAVEFAKKFDVEFEVRSSLVDVAGTKILSEDKVMEKAVVRGVSYQEKQAKITISGVDDKPGVASEIFTKLAEQELVIDMIVQNISRTNKTDISFTLGESEVGEAQSAIKPLIAEMSDEVSLDVKTGIAKLSVVGVGMRSHSGIAAKMFKALAEKNINIQMISTSEIKISITIDERELDVALEAVHSAFGLGASEGDKVI